MPRDPVSNYDKAALFSDLKMSGFEDCDAEMIAGRVDAKKAKGWTYEMARQEAIKEAKALLDKSHMALDIFRSQALPPTGKPRQRPFAEQIAEGDVI